MNIIGTAALLIVTLLMVPAISFLTGTALGAAEWSALQTLTGILLCAWAACFVAGEWTGNVSQVDKLWSILPVVYAWVVATHGDLAPRLLIMAICVMVWGVRLTLNFARHGAYRLKFWEGHEDYRWQVLRERPEFRPRWKWTLFNLLFISGYQNILILLITLPAIVAMQFSATPLNWLDLAAASVMLGMVLLETVADNQQWRFQSAKKAAAAGGRPLQGDMARGFLSEGLWSWSRHPNYLGEQGAWIAFYLFSVAASGQWINWSIGGCLLLVILFRGSSEFSEEISAGKYPEYARYQQTTPRFLPVKHWFRRP